MKFLINMQRKHTLFIFLLTFFVLSVNMVSASNGIYYKLNTSTNIQLTCLNDAFCSNTSFCNINIIDPTGGILVKNQNMSYNGSLHNYTIYPVLLGNYQLTGYCQDGSTYKEIDENFIITKTGEAPHTTAESIEYSIIMIFAFILFAGALFVFWVTPFDDKTDDFGRIILINKAKYVKLLFAGISYLMFVWVLNLLLGIATNYLNYEVFSGFTEMLFRFFIYLGYVIFVVLFVGFFYQLLKDIGRSIDINKFGYSEK